MIKYFKLKSLLELAYPSPSCSATYLQRAIPSQGNINFIS